MEKFQFLNRLFKSVEFVILSFFFFVFVFGTHFGPLIGNSHWKYLFSWIWPFNDTLPNAIISIVFNAQRVHCSCFSIPNVQKLFLQRTENSMKAISHKYHFERIFVSVTVLFCFLSLHNHFSLWSSTTSTLYSNLSTFKLLEIGCNSFRFHSTPNMCYMMMMMMMMSEMLSFLTSSDISIVECHCWHQNKNTLCVIARRRKTTQRFSIKLKRSNERPDWKEEKKKISKIFQSNRRFSFVQCFCSMPVDGLACAVNEMWWRKFYFDWDLNDIYVLLRWIDE